MLCLHPTGTWAKALFREWPTSRIGLMLPNWPSEVSFAWRRITRRSVITPTTSRFRPAPERLDESHLEQHSGDRLARSRFAEVDRDRIGCIGHSLGGHNSLFTAVFDQSLKAVVSSCGFTAFHNYYGGKLAGWTSPRYMPRISSEYGNDPSRVPFDFYEIVASLAPRAFFTNSPLHDSNFDVEGVKKVMAAAGDVYALYDARDRPGGRVSRRRCTTSRPLMRASLRMAEEAIEVLTYPPTNTTKEAEINEELPAMRHLRNSLLSEMQSRGSSFFWRLRGVRCVVVVNLYRQRPYSPSSCLASPLASRLQSPPKPSRRWISRGCASSGGGRS